MRNWLKKFEETTVGMLFSDQYLAPSEVVRIAESEKLRRCGTVCDEVAESSKDSTIGTAAPKREASAPHLIGLR